MRGHEALIAMRRQRIRPAAVYIEVGGDPLDCCRDWPEIRPASAQVQIGDDESLTGLDFRFAVGLTVCISGPNSKRVHAVFDAFKAVGASAVSAAVVTTKQVGTDWVATVTEVLQ